MRCGVTLYILNRSVKFIKTLYDFIQFILTSIHISCFLSQCYFSDFYFVNPQFRAANFCPFKALTLCFCLGGTAFLKPNFPSSHALCILSIPGPLFNFNLLTTKSKSSQVTLFNCSTVQFSFI